MVLLPASVIAQETAAPEAEELETAPEKKGGLEVDGKIVGELGFLDPMYHRIQFSKAGTDFDYVDEGGQDVLFNFQRLSAELAFNDNHKLIFLYQPINIETQVRLQRDVQVNGEVFEDGTPMDLTYSFPFYRISYLYDFWEEEDREIALGASLQLRNATIVFASRNGEQLRAERDVGPVPIIKFRTHVPLGNKLWFGFEADGFYAPIRYLNGGDSDVVGAIADLSLRLGRPISKHIDAFLNFRYLGGGGEGTSDDTDGGPGDDGFVKNWLHFATVSLGFSYSLQLTK